MAQIDSTSPDPVAVPCDGQPQFSYADEILTTSTGFQLHDGHIVAVVKAHRDEGCFKILSLKEVQAEEETSEETKSRLFELHVTKANSLPGNFLEKHYIKSLPNHLELANELQVLISTLSGTRLASEFYDEVLRPVLQNLSFEESQYTVVRTESAHTILNLAKSALAENANDGKKQTVVVLSGDGGVVDIINGLLESGERSRYDLHVDKEYMELICG
jgi:hypothetical protein